MKTAMYLFANNGLSMSPGKLAAQVSHAAVNAYIISQAATMTGDDDVGERIEVLDHWLRNGYTKLVMEARDTEHLLLIERVLKDKGYNVALIIDEGRTEIDPQTPTALGVEVVDRDNEQVQFDFADFRTLKPPKPPKASATKSWFRF